MARPHDPLPLDHYLGQLEQRIAQQEALVRRSIVQGAPTQAAEDRLRDLQQTFLRMTEQRRRMRTAKTPTRRGPS